jgi:translation initiation factor 3 subunit H
MAAPVIDFKAATEKKEVKETVLKTVQLDGQVALKIMQHCNDSLPNLVTGQLLGLDVGQTLEVTDCFPFPVSLAS